MTAEVKKKSKQIKKEIEKDEKTYYERDFGDGADVTSAWRRANEIMGNSKNLAPTSIKKKNENGEEEIVNNPQKLSIMFKNYLSSHLFPLMKYFRIGFPKEKNLFHFSS